MTNLPETITVNNVVLDSDTDEEIFFGSQMVMVKRETLEANVGHADNVYNHGETFYTAEYMVSEEAHSYGETYGVATVIHYLESDREADMEEKETEAINLVEEFRKVMYSDR